MRKIALLCMSIVLFLSISDPLLAKGAKPIIKKSAICEKVSLNIFALGFDDLASIKNQKNVFTPKDDKVAWTARVRKAGQNSNELFRAYWYGPEGELISCSVPKNVSMESSNLKASLPLENRELGLYKIEVIYKDYLVEEQYFKVAEDPNEKIEDAEIAGFETVLKKPFLLYKDIQKDPLGGWGGDGSAREDIKKSYVYSKKVNSKEKAKCPVFVLDENNLSYRCNFRSISKMAGAKVTWIAPDGQLLIGKDVKYEYMMSPYLKSKLNLAKYGGVNKDGLWKVECVRNGEIIDGKYFLFGDHKVSDVSNVDVSAFEDKIKKAKKSRFSAGSRQLKTMQKQEMLQKVEGVKAKSSYVPKKDTIKSGKVYKNVFILKPLVIYENAYNEERIYDVEDEKIGKVVDQAYDESLETLVALGSDPIIFASLSDSQETAIENQIKDLQKNTEVLIKRWKDKSKYLEDFNSISKVSGCDALLVVVIRVKMGSNASWDPILTGKIVPTTSTTMVKSVLIDLSTGDISWFGSSIAREMPNKANLKSCFKVLFGTLYSD